MGGIAHAAAIHKTVTCGEARVSYTYLYVYREWGGGLQINDAKLFSLEHNLLGQLHPLAVARHLQRASLELLQGACAVLADGQLCLQVFASIVIDHVELGCSVAVVGPGVCNEPFAAVFVVAQKARHGAEYFLVGHDHIVLVKIYYQVYPQLFVDKLSGKVLG